MGIQKTKTKKTELEPSPTTYLQESTRRAQEIPGEPRGGTRKPQGGRSESSEELQECQGETPGELRKAQEGAQES